MKTKQILIFTVLPFALIACSSSNKPSVDDATQAINNALDKAPICSIQAAKNVSFLAGPQMGKPDNKEWAGSNEETFSPQEFLIKQGIMKFAGFTKGKDELGAPVYIRHYTVTEQGKKYFTDATMQRVCVARYVVSKIDLIGDPGAIGIPGVVPVKAEYAVQYTVPWAQSPEAIKALHLPQPLLSSGPVVATPLLQKQADGSWQVQ